MRNGLRIRLILKELHVEAFYNMPSSSCVLFFLQPYEGSKGCEACCPHFQQTMQLHEQRMKLKLSMQSNTRQWRLRITQNTIEAHVHPHKYYVHVCTCTHKDSVRSTLLLSTHTHTNTYTYTQTLQDCSHLRDWRINSSIERRCYLSSCPPLNVVLGLEIGTEHLVTET